MSTLRRKWTQHRYNAKKKGVQSHLTFAEFAAKVNEAGITENEIGRGVHQYQLGRIGDVGDYTVDNCRFITHHQNRLEKIANGGSKPATEAMNSTVRGHTKHTSSGIAKMAHTNSYDFEATSPSGETFRGRNLKQFCIDNGLTPPLMSRVANGLQSHHKGWKVRYVSST